MKNEMKDERAVWGILLPDERTDERTDICDCRVTFETENGKEGIA